MFNFPKCPKCGNTLPIATGVCASCPISPLPGQEDQSARLAASAEVGQVEGTKPQKQDLCSTVEGQLKLMRAFQIAYPEYGA